MHLIRNTWRDNWPTCSRSRLLWSHTFGAIRISFRYTSRQPVRVHQRCGVRGGSRVSRLLVPRRPSLPKPPAIIMMEQSQPKSVAVDGASSPLVYPPSMKAALYLSKTIFTVTTLNLSPRISTDVTTLMVLTHHICTSYGGLRLRQPRSHVCGSTSRHARKARH